jgi:hypothetical protein
LLHPGHPRAADGLRRIGGYRETDRSLKEARALK